MPTLPIAKLVNNGIDDADARALIDWIRWWRPLKITRLAGSGFRHPWDIIPRWNGKKKYWEIQIAPGYINAMEVLANDQPLSAEPWIPIENRQLRSIGYGSPGGLDAEPVPPYFRKLGVREADAVTRSEFGLTTNLDGTLEDRAQARLLRAVDILVEQPRPRVETVIETDAVNGNAQLVASIATPVGAAAAPRIRLRREAVDPEPLPGTIQSLLATGAVDDGLDRLRLATLYFLSPPGAVSGNPDGSWQAIPANEEFWDLSHDLTRDIGVVPPFRLSLGVPLAGGLAQSLVNDLLETINAADAAAAAFLSRARIEGRFWSV